MLIFGGGMAGAARATDEMALNDESVPA